MNSAERYVLLGLARPRAAWFSEVSRWATSAIVPAEFVKCVSAEEVRARFASGRVWSAILLDGTLPVVDRDLLLAARDAGCAPIVIDDTANRRWRDIGALAVLPTTFDRRSLLEVLESLAITVDAPMRAPDDVVVDDGRAGADGGLVVAVCGAGGTGASTAAASLAQGLAAMGRDVVVADLARHAEQALLHDVGDVVPGVQELVEAHRNGVPDSRAVRSLTFTMVDRGYALLLGLRRARYWPTLRPRAFEAAFGSLVSAFDVTVCDVTADFESEADAGSADVEERNVASRTAIAAADVIVVVGRPGVKGLHAMVRVVGDVVAADVPATRVLPLVMCAPRSPRSRAEITAAVHELARPVTGAIPMPSPLFLPTRSVDDAVRDGAPLPSPLPGRLADAVLAVRDLVGPRPRGSATPSPVAPGTLGSFGS